LIITVVKVEAPQPVPGKKYQTMELNYKDSYGNVKGKKLLSFSAPLVFNTLKGSKKDDCFEVTEDDTQYKNWTEIKKAEPPAQEASQSLGGKSSSQTFAAQANDRYETKEERSARQVMIVRQSSLSNAIQSLAVGGKSALDPATVIDVAKKYENFVLKNDPIQELMEMEDDLPD
jgi:uncharacterized GH25 family protein